MEQGKSPTEKPKIEQGKAENPASKFTPSALRQGGRRVRLFFHGPVVPILQRIEFQLNSKSNVEYRQQRDRERAFQLRTVAKAISLLFVEYAVWGLEGGKGEFRFEGPERQEFSAAIGEGVYKPSANLFDIFSEVVKNDVEYYAKDIFLGQNRSATAQDDREQFITINPDFLRPDCVEIFWNAYGDSPLKDWGRMNELASQVRKVLGVPEKLTKPVGEASAEISASASPPSPGPTETPKTIGRPSAIELFEPQVAPDIQVLPSTPEVRTKSPAPQFTYEFKTPQAESLESRVKPPPSPALTIDPKLFEITNPNEDVWEDDEGLINLGYSASSADVWKIRDACEGVLILGAIGSGKTSGTGNAIARTYLTSGFGGLVLTVKPDEAARWIRLCRETGREDDCIHVTATSGHKLNILQYEAQRPGERISITEDVIGLFRALLETMRGGGKKESKSDFWSESVDLLLRKMVELFLLAEEPLAVDRMERFMNAAPQSPGQSWRGIQWFSDIIIRAEDAALDGTATDQEVFLKAFEYWTQAYPKIPDVTRGGIISNYSAMAGALGARGINEMVCTETNLTPEMILSGKVVILDISLKGNVTGGFMVQAAWKLLFQYAAERRSDKGRKTARPSFLWEDEGHMFVSHHDAEFQPTARDSRAPRVIISQNIENFLRNGADKHNLMAVFSSMNTYFFHTNNDVETNCWASSLIGEITTKHLTSSGTMIKPFSADDYSFFGRDPNEVKHIGQYQISEETKLALRPEDFAKLKRGGPPDGVCQAVVFWLAHRFEANHGRNFCVVTFDQEKQATRT